MNILEAIVIILYAIIGIALSYINYGMSRSQKRLMENEAEIERRIMEEKFKNQN